MYYYSPVVVLFFVLVLLNGHVASSPVIRAHMDVVFLLTHVLGTMLTDMDGFFVASKCFEIF